jgi:hypothetical protein
MSSSRALCNSACSHSRAAQVKEPLDVFLSHDWPTHVARYGDTRRLFRAKPYFEKEALRDELGSPPAWQLLQVRSAHLQRDTAQATASGFGVTPPSGCFGDHEPARSARRRCAHATGSRGTSTRRTPRSCRTAPTAPRSRPAPPAHAESPASLQPTSRSRGGRTCRRDCPISFALLRGCQVLYAGSAATSRAERVLSFSDFEAPGRHAQRWCNSPVVSRPGA